jgi:hypothetical protein
MSEKDDSVRKLPPTLEDLAASGTVEEPAKRRKTIHPKQEDDSTTKACIAIANHHSMLSNAESVKLPSRAGTAPSPSARRTHHIEIRTNINPIDQLRQELPSDAPPPAGQVDDAERTISGTTFGLTQLMNIFDENQRYWNRRTSQKTDEGIEGYEKEEVSRFHIKKILWAHSAQRSLSPCLMGESGFCRAQIEVSLKHPLAPDAPCIAYYTAREYDAVIHGLAANPEKTAYCEFCYRYNVELEVERIKHSAHRSETEIPDRYYKAGVPGEYSVAGMHQPVEKKTTQYPDGILGHMRKFNTSDFVPVVARLVDGEPEETWHVDAYQRMLESGSITREEPVLYGWEETKPIQQLNDSALFEVNQIDPYERVTIDTAEEMTVASVLRDHFERRATTMHENFVHIFQDLMDCVNDPEYTTLPHAYSHTPDSESWQRFCMHDTTQPFDFSLHRIYHVLLVKINTCKQMVFNGEPLRVTEHIKQKLQKFISAHHDLIQWMMENEVLSDAELLSHTVQDPVLDIEVPVLFAYYPRDNHHYRDRDYDLVQFQKTVRRRDNPMEVTRRYYVTASAERLAKPLIALPHTFEPPAKIADDALPASYVASIKKKFEQNVEALRMYDHELQWSNPDIGRLRRNLWDRDEGTPKSDAEVRAEALELAIAELQYDFASVQQLASERCRKYHDLIGVFADVVFCDFNETVLWLMYHDDISEVVEYAQSFVTMLPCRGMRIQTDPTSVNGVSWQKHCVLAACLLRSYVAEELRGLEPPEHSHIRYNLLLFRDSHLALFRKITENPDSLLTDIQLGTARGKQTVTLMDYYYPYPQREVHQGSLPDYVDSLTKVNFMSDGGMDDYAWIKMQFKKPDRCCDGREFHEMLRTLCMKDETFYRYTCLELELSFKGHYEHCTVVPSFARAVLLDELFDNATDPEVRDNIFRMIVDNQELIAEATSESLCYMLEHAAPLRDVLREVYRDWFAWRAKANMDMARKCFNDDGNFSRVSEIVYERIKLHSNKIIYRHVESNFVIWLCSHIKKSNEDRYKSRTPERYTAPEDLPSYQERLIINCVIFYLSPTQSIDATDLEIVGLSKPTIDVLYDLYEIFRYQTNKNLGLVERESAAPTGTVKSHLKRLSHKQYNLASFFFQSLQRYQTVRTMKINNFGILKKQQQALLQKHGYSSLDALPPNTTKTVFSTCCLNVKNTFSKRADMFAMGTEDVYYSPMENTYTCAKKEHRTGKRKAAAPAKSGKQALKQEEQLMRPICDETEVIIIDALGELVETDGCKIPHAKKNNASAEKSKNVAPPTGPYWITPCCGSIFGYQYDKWYPGGYACGVCSDNNKLAETFDAIFCDACTTPVKKEGYDIVKTFDDAFTHTYTRIVLCHRCKKNWRFWNLSMMPTSVILKGTIDEDYVEAYAKRADFD